MTLTEGQSLKRRKMMIQQKFVREMDSFGRIVLPRDFRNAMCWKDGTKISIIRDGRKLILQEENGSCFLEGEWKREKACKKGRGVSVSKHVSRWNK